MHSFPSEGLTNSTCTYLNLAVDRLQNVVRARLHLQRVLPVVCIHDRQIHCKELQGVLVRARTWLSWHRSERRLQSAG